MTKVMKYQKNELGINVVLVNCLSKSPCDRHNIIIEMYFFNYNYEVPQT